MIGLLRAQTAVTVEAIEAVHAWAAGDDAAADRVRRLEHEADTRKHELRDALTQMFAPPLEPEDLFTLSQGIDVVLESAKNTVREAQLMGTQPDQAMIDMTAELMAGAGRLAEAFAALGDRDSAATAMEAADRAIHSKHRVEHVYRRAMSALVDLEDIGEVTARRELYRRLVRTGDHLVAVAERVWYAVLKQS